MWGMGSGTVNESLSLKPVSHQRSEEREGLMVKMVFVAFCGQSPRQQRSGFICSSSEDGKQIRMERTGPLST